MHEPKRTNLLDVVLKSLAVANRKTFIHRLIYIVGPSKAGQRGVESWLRILERNLRRLNDERWDDSLAGLALLYPSHIIHILEGSEDLLDKHVMSFLKLIKEEPYSSEIKVKILVMIPHIIKRYFVSWRGVSVSPPVLIDNIPEPAEPQHHTAKAKECILKLYRLSNYLCQQSEVNYRTSPDNLSKTCKQFLPETAVLDFLLSSPLLLTGEEYVKDGSSAPTCQFYHELVWPAPPDFVPHNVFSHLQDKTIRDEKHLN